ncbi:NCR1, Niemann-pick type C [Neohortaea acidophila]|uniref:NCR1, Niemann-pick type C n=1 Tax=Neohortaea acidophila TaxID=245834 RepID=A0A6A6Q231_9PEZI|nr:NCR1, Niemann-pick type C [Neohortaea acidophila]KAF2485467.1 NCR1, Niemann-pick type C [Neohortaea acidophila]
MKTATWLRCLPLFLLTLPSSAIDSNNPLNLTKIHEAGRCAVRGNCGSESLFGKQLPCADNGLAGNGLSASARDQLVELCGEEWTDTKVCCADEQVDDIKTNFDRVNFLIASCPACLKNFRNMFCHFTCSPDQSLFVNVTQTKEKSDKIMTTELDHLISDEYGSGLYDSCKEIQFAGGKSMTYFGNAKNYTQFLAFLGTKSTLGSPFQMNFPRPNEHPFKDMHPVLDDAIPCNTSDKRYQCMCNDCPAICPSLDPLEEPKECKVGLLPCLSFAIILVYAVFVTLLVLAVSGHAAAAKRRQNRNERLQLLQDSAPDEDDDERDVVHGAGGLLDRPTRQYPLNTYCDRAFSKLARTCANFPAITIVSSIIVIGIFSLGWIRFDLETDPVNLWVAPESAAAQEKAFFDSNFGPFFRTEQAFLVNDTHADGHGPVLSANTLRWWFDVERRVRIQKSPKHGLTLKDVCYDPLGGACVVQSITHYFDSQELDMDNWEKQLQHCADVPSDCRPDFQQPMPIERLLGGYNRTSQPVTDAEALIVTWVVQNYNPGDPRLEKAEEWEDSLKRLLMDVAQEAQERGLRLSFSTEISLEQELNQSANTDAKIVVISYLVMFFYASLALGSTTLTLGSILRNPATALVQSKFMLGIVGILIVLMSVAASVGLFAATGLKATLIIAEVIPFLVLAVGVDNIFLIVHEFERVNINHADESVPDRLARALGRMGPSILLSASTETVAFALGAAVGMPAVRNFAAYAAGAVFINAVLQVTMFISVLALNQERVEAGRADCIPCIKVQGGSSSSMPNGYGGAPFSGTEEEGPLARFIRRYYAPAILGNRTRVAIVTVFLGFFAAGIALLPDLKLGLDQRIAVPSSSYLVKYFDDLYDYFGAGPPVYFVTRNVNATARTHQQELCAKELGCNRLSVPIHLGLERTREHSYIADTTASWLDDFWTWLNPENTACCVDESGSPCFANHDPPWDQTLQAMPQGEEFVYYAQRWLKAPTTEDCPPAGKAQYADAVVIDNTTINVPASHFRTAHSALTSQEDLINSYASARRIAKEISQENDGIDVFPYSKHYIFFDMYAGIVRLSTALVGAALAFIFFTTSLLLGSIATGLVVTVTVTMIVVDVVATMTLADVSLNAVSLVNIIICVGIGVEFCAHIARAFTIPSASILERASSKFRGKQARAWAALVNVGGSVFSGITITKLLGVFVLAFTRSKIFEIYYFRVWLALIIWAALHALVFLPVALSLFGGAGYLDPESDGGLEQDLASRRYRALLPDEEYDSDDY